MEISQRRLDLKIAEIKLAEANLRADEMKELVAIVFKSPVYKKTVSTSTSEFHDCQSQQKTGENRTADIQSSEE